MSETETTHLVLLGREFKIVKTFPDTDQGTKDANAWMEANPRHGVIHVANGKAYIAHMDDKGVKV